jgi:ATP-dependent DNA helicase RecG
MATKKSQHIESKESQKDEFLKTLSAFTNTASNALQHFLLTANNLTWDEITVPNTSWDEIDEETVRLFIRKAADTNRLPLSEKKSNNIRDLFERLGLSKNGLLTRAALLLFSKMPTRHFSLAVCKIGRFREDSHTDLIMDNVIECPLFKMPDLIMTTLKSQYLRTIYIYKGLHRVPTLEYPENSLREAILNAIIHRDYGGNTFFTIKVFDNSLELWNEGELMFPLDIESLKKQHSSRLRNKLIASIFYRSGQMESWGQGTLKMLEAAQVDKYPEPEFEYIENGILVKFDKKVFEIEQQHNKSIAEIKYADKILNLIRENPSITNRKMAQALSMSDRNTRRVLTELINSKIIDRIGVKKTAVWVIINDTAKMS